MYFKLVLSEKQQNVRRLEAQRNDLNAKVRLLREELQLLQEQGSHVGEVIKPMDKKKVLVKVKFSSSGSVLEDTDLGILLVLGCYQSNPQTIFLVE